MQKENYFLNNLDTIKLIIKSLVILELLLRFLMINRIKYKYLQKPFVLMETGGIKSNRSLKSNYTLNREILRACKENGVKTNYFCIYSKYFMKIFEF